MITNIICWLSQCFLCPGNSRAGGEKNPDYKENFVFVNDYSAVKEEQADYNAEAAGDGMDLDTRLGIVYWSWQTCLRYFYELKASRADVMS